MGVGGIEQFFAQLKQYLMAPGFCFAVDYFTTTLPSNSFRTEPPGPNPLTLHPLLDSIAFRLPQGELSRIIRTEEGLHVLLVEVILEKGKTRPFDLIEEELKKKIYEMRSLSILNEYTDKLRKEARIELLDRMADNKLGQE